MQSTPVRSFVQRHPVIVFFGLSYLLAWGVWIPTGLLVPQLSTALVLPGAWAPTIAALVLTALLEGRAGVRRLLQSVTRWRVAWRWYLLATLGPTAIALGAIAIHVLLGGTTPSLATTAARFGLASQDAALLVALLPVIFIITIFAGGPIAEELGWRGFAQPRLQAHLGPARAGALIGAVWAVWHLPLALFIPTATGDIPFGWYAPLVTAFGVWFGWLYQRTNGSVLLCILLHAGINFTIGALGLVSSDPQILTMFVLLCGGAALVAGIALRRNQHVAAVVPTR